MEQYLAAQRAQPATLPQPPQLKQEPQPPPRQAPQAGGGGGGDTVGGKVRSAFEPVAQQTPPPTFGGRHEVCFSDCPVWLVPEIYCRDLVTVNIILPSMTRRAQYICCSYSKATY